MLPHWSAEYVVAHANWSQKRGRRPSMAYRGISNPAKALILAKKMVKDQNFKDVVVAAVNEDSFTREDGWSFGIQEDWTVKPKTGDIARFYGHGIGCTVRGLDINGQPCYYRTEEEQRIHDAEEHARWEAEEKAVFEKNKASLDKKYHRLPKVFQQRIDKFRSNNPNFRWKYEDYEMFCCEQAVLIARTVRRRLKIAADKKHLTVGEFNKLRPGTNMLILDKLYDMSYKKQFETISGLSHDHSGNTMGCSFALAGLYLTKPKNIVKAHGALSVLVGSEEYGDFSHEEIITIKLFGCLPN